MSKVCSSLKNKTKKQVTRPWYSWRYLCQENYIFIIIISFWYIIDWPPKSLKHLFVVFSELVHSFTTVKPCGRRFHLPNIDFVFKVEQVWKLRKFSFPSSPSGKLSFCHLWFSLQLSSFSLIDYRLTSKILRNACDKTAASRFSKTTANTSQNSTEEVCFCQKKKVVPFRGQTVKREKSQRWTKITSATWRLSSLHCVGASLSPVIACLQSRTRVFAAVGAESWRRLTNTSLPLCLSHLPLADSDNNITMFHRLSPLCHFPSLSLFHHSLSRLSVTDTLSLSPFYSPLLSSPTVILISPSLVLLTAVP